MADAAWVQIGTVRYDATSYRHHSDDVVSLLVGSDGLFCDNLDTIVFVKVIKHCPFLISNPTTYIHITYFIRASIDA